ncbi:hypothetical protein DS2_17427 [Catenovulum agarivorans DS-2]|uniref:Uncharacterized protein n=2 Tax=Catenovulum agarivorans TaxID=1172192 RepID=W7QSQ0_9ALTE|nr:hypothetical protein DS2_17427 [Catenovulum agarivorans DS-2]
MTECALKCFIMTFCGANVHIRNSKAAFARYNVDRLGAVAVIEHASNSSKQTGESVNNIQW